MCPLDQWNDLSRPAAALKSSQGRLFLSLSSSPSLPHSFRSVVKLTCEASRGCFVLVFSLQNKQSAVVAGRRRPRSPSQRGEGCVLSAAVSRETNDRHGLSFGPTGRGVGGLEGGGGARCGLRRDGREQRIMRQICLKSNHRLSEP